MIIGISGKIGSGKSVIAKEIEIKVGFRRLSTSDLLKGILESKGIEPSREKLQEMGDNLIKTVGGSGYMVIMLTYLPPGNYLIDSIRHSDALKFMKVKYGRDFVNIFVDTPENTRYFRRKEQYDSFEHFKKIDSANTEIEIESLKDHSDFVINNRVSLPDVKIQVEEIFKKINNIKNQPN